MCCSIPSDLLYKTTVQEVMVEVDSASVAGTDLTVTRVDAEPNIMCRVSTQHHVSPTAQHHV